MPRLLLLLFLTLMTPAAQAAIYYVAPDGNDSAAGTIHAPWATIHHAAATLQAGDTVYIRGGTYRITSRIEPVASGTAEAWITYAAYPGEEPVINAADFIPPEGQHDYGAITVRGPSYIRIKGLTVREVHCMGINVRGPGSHHIEILDCFTSTTFSPGIGVWNASFIRIIGCTVTDANSNAMRLYGDFTREAPHEAISTGGATDFEIAYCHVYDSNKEGIDIKEVSARGVVHHNYVHHLPRQGLYADAWFGLLHDVEFHHNVVHDCEWGMAISAEGQASSTRDAGELERVQVHHNLFFNNRASGIFFSIWGGDNERRDIEIYNNTFYNNGRVNHWSGPTGNIDLRSENVRNVHIYNNICDNGAAYEIGTFDDPSDGLEMLAARNVVIENNLCESFKDDTNHSWLYNRNYGWVGEEPIMGDPQFIDPFNEVFLLSETSPAIDAGLLEGIQSAEDPGAPDLGALFLGIDDLPLASASMTFLDHGMIEVFQPTVPWLDYTVRSSHDLQTWTSLKDSLGPSWAGVKVIVPLGVENQSVFVSAQVQSR